jgi:hypothetical protein
MTRDSGRQAFDLRRPRFIEMELHLLEWPRNFA